VNQRPTPRPITRSAWSLTDRLNDAQHLAIVHAYLSGATAAQLAAAYGLSLSSLKRILRSAKATKTYVQS
jgi:DNA-directed RNA polymerase specialized sigma24 family protein